MTKKLITSGAKWEPIVGYSRAVIVGDVMEIAGTTASEGGRVLFPGEPDRQTEYILNLFKNILEENGFSLEHVVRTRIYVTKIEDWEKIGSVHGLFFSKIRPASTMLQVGALVDKEMLVEIEATAIRSEK